VPRRALELAVILAVATAAVLPARAVATAAPPPPGQLVAEGIPYATNVAFDARGGMWVTSGAPFNQAGDGVWYVRRAGARPIHVIRDTRTALGLTWFRGRLYVVSQRGERTGIVARYSGFDGRRFAGGRRVVLAIPVWQHPLGTIVRGPAGRLYVGVGAEQNALAGGHQTSGTVVSFKGDGSDLRIEATGLRGPYGLAFIPRTASLLVTDNGRDDLGPSRPPDELNLVRDVTHRAPDFGFPACSDLGGPACRSATAPLAALPAHSAPGGVAVARDWGGRGLTAFVAENGAVAPGVTAGRELLRVELRRRPAGGYDAHSSVFAAGFADQDPLGVAIGPGGALYVTLFRTGGVVRFFPGFNPSPGAGGAAPRAAAWSASPR
jgi:glucose/arabinose dehydrogenase